MCALNHTINSASSVNLPFMKFGGFARNMYFSSSFMQTVMFYPKHHLNVTLKSIKKS